MFASLLLKWERKLKPEDFEDNILMLLSVEEDCEDVDRSILLLSGNSTKLSHCLQSFRSCCVQREPLASDYLFKVKPVKSDGDQLDDDGSSSVTFESAWSSSLISLVAHCVKSAAEGAKMTAFLMTQLVNASIKAFKHVQRSIFWMSVLFKIPPKIMFVRKLQQTRSKNSLCRLWQQNN